MMQSMMLSIPLAEQYEPPVLTKPIGLLTLGSAEKYTDLRGSYWRYPILQDGQLSNHHRYSEFLWLRNELVACYPGLCIPTLPDKEGLSSYWSSHSEEFIRYRRHGLEQFVQFCAGHKVLKAADAFRAFLEDDEFKFALRTRSTQGETGILSYFTGWGSSLVSSVSKYVYGGTEGIALSSEDQEFATRMTSVYGLKMRSEELCEDGKNFIAKLSAEAESNYALAKAYENLARVESEDLSRQLMLLSAGHQKISQFIIEARTEVSNLFGEQLEDSLRVTRGALEAFERRQEVVEKVLQEKASIGKQGYTESEVICERLRDYERLLSKISEQLHCDMEGFYILRSKVLQQVAGGYVRCQLALAEKVEEAWREVQHSMS
jgi:hypothetical protein